jgi:hypothetical protein
MESNLIRRPPCAFMENLNKSWALTFRKSKIFLLDSIFDQRPVLLSEMSCLFFSASPVELC